MTTSEFENSNVIKANFFPNYRATIAQHIKFYGVARTEQAMLWESVHPSFTKAIIRSIMRLEGW